MNTFCMKLTRYKQFCLFIKQAVGIIFQNLISLHYPWASRRVFSFCPLCRRYRFLVQKLDSHYPWYIASLATRSILLDNSLNTSSAHLPALSWHIFKIEVWKDKVPTLCQSLLWLGQSLVFLICNTDFSTEKVMC